MTRAILIDTGTTNTRVWSVDEGRVLARAQAQVGARDAAREGNSGRLRRTLRDLIAEVRARLSSDARPPSCVIGAGMLTSRLGLAEVGHLGAPVGLDDLAAGLERHSFPEIVELPFLLVPGVRTGPPGFPRESVGACDVMRGEESLAQGLLSLGLIERGSVLLNLGSHWKAIALDQEGRIISSVTSLAGEMIYAVQSETILADALPRHRAEEIDLLWCEAGVREEQRGGLARALFCVRLLQLGAEGTPAERMAFLAGAFIGAELRGLLSNRVVIPGVSPVFISGSGPLAAAWQHVLLAHEVRATILSETEIESGLVAGLIEIAKRGTSI